MRYFISLSTVFLVFFSITTESYTFIYDNIHSLILNEKSYSNCLVYYYSYFTIQSNLAVGITSLMLLFKSDYSKKWFRILQLDGIICITITCIVYNIALRHDHKLKGIIILTNEALHVIIPFLSVLYWILYGFVQKLDKKCGIILLFLFLEFILLYMDNNLKK